MENLIASRPLYRSRIDYAAIALPVLIWAIAVAVANPLGNFPLQDDWSFSLTVRHLLETGEFRPLGWTAMSLFGQTVWGALFCLPFGFSFNALRASTLVAGALTLAALAILLQLAGCERRKTVVATLILAFNPIFFELNNTFMTDVAFTAFSAISTLFFCRYLSTRNTVTLVIAILSGCWAIMIRQLGLFLPLAMVLTLLLENRRDWRAITLSVVAVLAGIGLLKGLSIWLTARDTMPVMYLGKTSIWAHVFPASTITLTTVGHRLGEISWWFRAALGQIGWLLLPVLALRLPGLVRDYARLSWGKAVLIGAALCGVGWYALLVHQHHIFPFNTWTTVRESGLGPIWFFDARSGGDVPPLPAVFWHFATLSGCVGGVLLLLDIALGVRSVATRYRARRHDTALSVRTYLLLSAAIYLAICVLAGFYDRYLLPAFLPLIAFITLAPSSDDAAWPSFGRPRMSSRTRHAWLWPRAALALSWFALILMGGYAVGGTHDYMSWNRARWLLADTLLQRGIPVTQIDGGYEFNGYYLYDPKIDLDQPQPKSWWVHDNQYLIQFKPMAGYRVIDSADAGGWLPPLKRKLLTLQRESP
ncbi:glycosyltransferase family 39 protein [Paraburkholderia sartisoli]|uniref:Dolichyl-phosphate-mannose-protein mannosyltransferase n=1 Tax=Paraburkholderia sartisoli TaxID=83784 RepID=A0A1H4D7F2_9BURK|nr:glycosyltransferase family 39 protein [Paraburkholderia sartisoli]SEA68349.1 Dolichyl-phosphate-mannose-protein mannosyltransferase [Paraburkholderia sartisoli]